MKKVLFLLGAPAADSCHTGQPVTQADWEVINEIGEKLEVEIVIELAVPDSTGRLSGAGSKVLMSDIRIYRDSVLQTITDHNPNVVMACGPVALKCLLNKGVSLKDHLREQLRIPELSDIICCATQSMEQLAAKPGTKKMLMLDTVAAVLGHTETSWGRYKVLLPGTPEWAVMPAELKGKDTLGVDLETYPGLDPWHPDARIRMAVISDRVGRAWIVQARKDSRFPAWFRKLVEDPKIVCGGSNIKFDYKWLSRFGYTMTNMWDTSTAEHVIDCTNPFTDLKSLTFTYCPKLGDYSKGHRELVKERGGWELVNDDEMWQYAGGDGEASIAAIKGQKKTIKNKKLERPFKLSTELYKVLADMETQGSRICMETNSQLGKEFEQGLIDLRDELIKTLGPINPNSPAQVVDALIKTVPNINLSKSKLVRQFSSTAYKLPSDSKDNDYSTDKAVLEREASKHDIIKTLLLYRKYSKLYTTYVKSLREKYCSDHGHNNYFVHTSYRPDVVETYRLSSQGPNLQNIPRKPDPEEDVPLPQHLNIKRQFISRWTNGHIIEADLSQAEIRIAAHLSQDPLMMDAIKHGEDVHRAMTSKFLDKPENEVTKLERTEGKRTNFLVIYGGGANTLSKQIGCTKARAKKLLNQYFSTFNKLDEYMNKCGYDVMKTLQSESMFGYVRRFRKPSRWDDWEGWRIRRQAWNHRVQNGAACCTFVSMIDLFESMQKNKLRSIIQMQVHDSILIDTYPGEEDVVAELAKYHLENPNLKRWKVELTVPLVADVEIGKCWGDMSPFEFSS